jgi:hypothetical protein
VASQEDRIALAVAQRAGQGADAARIASSVCAFWEQIEAALAPLVGQRGVAALYRRSLYLAAVGHPWLEPPEDPQPALDLTALNSMLARQNSAEEAAAGGVAMLQAFQTLLTSLIGSSLTERLLDTVWKTQSLSNGLPVQDSST